MTDWRGLCEELMRELHGYASANPHHDSDALVARARAALAQPEPEVVGPTDEELLELYPATMVDQEDAFAFARAVLARYGRPAPAPASEVAELVWELRQEADLQEELRQEADLQDVYYTSPEVLRYAADLLERQAAPVPVAVSERLPGDALCWWYEPDEDDDPSGYGGCWTLLRIRGAVSYYTHWLPVHALPLPSREVEA